MAFGTSIKLSNIRENWLFQLGFANGDAHAKGEGGWDAVLQSDGTANLLTADVNDSTTTIPVDDASVFTTGDYIKIESEIVKITSMSSNDLTVIRTQMGTSAEAHENNDAIYWNNFTPLAFTDTTVDSVFYHGVITNKPSIRESLNLAKSTTNTGNLTITIPDFSYKGSPISQLLSGGVRTPTYINYTTKIFSIINNDTKTQIGSFRLNSISYRDDMITIQFTSPRPWDLISIPQDKTSSTNNYFPIVYGFFTPETSTVSSPQFVNSARLFPAPVDSINHRKYYCLLPSVNADSGRLHYYEKNAEYPHLSGGYGDGGEVFVPMDEANDDYESYQGGQAITTPVDLDRALRLLPNSTTGLGAVTGENMLDGDGGTYAEFTEEEFEDAGLDISNVSGGDDNQTITLSFKLPQIDHEIQSFKTVLIYEIDFNTSINSARVYIDINEVSYGETDDAVTIDNQYTYSGSISTATINKTSDIDGQIPDAVTINMNVRFTTESGAGGTLSSLSIKLYQIYFEVESKVPIEDADKSNTANNSIKDIKHLYCGEYGYSKNGWDGSGILGLINDAHRDILIRYAGLSVEDPDGWSALDTAKDWGIRWWLLNPVSLSSVLEKLQYEGGFIFRWTMEGNPQYVFIPDTITIPTGNTLTKEDIKDISINLTPTSELLTHMEIDYEKHPAENRYLTSVTSINSPERKKRNISAKENKKQVKLDAYVSPTIPTSPASNPNDDFYTYYDNIFGTLKLIVTGIIVNPKFYTLEVGQFVDFDNDNMHPEKAFGEAWTNKKFMIISLTRAIGTLQFKAREVG